MRRSPLVRTGRVGRARTFARDTAKPAQGLVSHTPGTCRQVLRKPTLVALLDLGGALQRAAQQELVDDYHLAASVQEMVGPGLQMRRKL